MLLELIVNVGSIRIDRQNGAIDDKGSKCQWISGSCFQRTARNLSAFAGYQILVATRFRMVLCKDFVQRIDLEQIWKHSEVSDDADPSGNGVDFLIGWFQS